MSKLKELKNHVKTCIDSINELEELKTKAEKMLLEEVLSLPYFIVSIDNSSYFHEWLKANDLNALNFLKIPEVTSHGFYSTIPFYGETVYVIYQVEGDHHKVTCHCENTELLAFFRLKHDNIR